MFSGGHMSNRNHVLYFHAVDLCLLNSRRYIVMFSTEQFFFFFLFVHNRRPFLLFHRIWCFSVYSQFCFSFSCNDSWLVDTHFLATPHDNGCALYYCYGFFFPFLCLLCFVVVDYVGKVCYRSIFIGSL